ncbi:alpha/beta hydrolase family protein [Thermocaproicibacter melissae]|jgi:pimeloyl-ACP methyl ester carboxylesterase|uniref:alpha/beta hydrolase family protein n=1 Tax=Thermocaproicibacter melissae TaxID=2966552 RepID=UPI0024B24320|nr:alpha/beta fold hydrolase [Thermocaproicibacter melissae]WBY64477.1 alpha/beta hydrolase [Thermocaproicibacter melissae]
MSYQQLNPITQLNFQANRVLTYGSLACNAQEVQEAVRDVRTLEEWDRAWSAIAQKAERKKRWLHAAYYYRMVEFFLKAENPRKEQIYEKCLACFYRGFDDELHLRYQRHDIPFEGGTLHAIHIPAEKEKGTVLVCGGYDSFIEEFVLQIRDLADRGYSVVLFEGPGQGWCLREKMYFRHDFEKPASAVLDYFGIKRCAMVGISWGGYFVLRCAAFEKRIVAAAAYDVMDNGLEVMTNVFPKPICCLIRWALRHRKEKLVNGLTARIRKRSILADWALSQGMTITGTETVFAFYEALSRHTLSGIEDRITQDILLLAGEKDHYIPVNQYYRLKESLHHAKSLTCRLFTEAEGGEQHCQIGNHMLAVNTILDWLDRVYGEHFTQS